MDILLLAIFVLVPYAITVIPGLFLVFYLRRQEKPIELRRALLLGMAGAALLSPALVAGHMPYLLPFGFLLLLSSQFTPAPWSWNSGVAAAVFIGLIFFQRERSRRPQ